MKLFHNNTFHIFKICFFVLQQWFSDNLFLEGRKGNYLELCAELADHHKMGHVTKHTVQIGPTAAALGD